MPGNSAIEWTDRTWNPVVGCTKVSQGCRFCYALTLHDMRHRARLEGKPLPEQYAMPFERVQLKPERLGLPLRWRRPSRIFVNSMSDLFHEDVPFHYVAAVFGIMAAARHHTFQVLTKRPQRMLEFFRWVGEHKTELTEEAKCCYHCTLDSVGESGQFIWPYEDWAPWPLPNVWLGVTAENQQAANERIPLLLEAPAAVRFLSCEPLLGLLDLSPWLEQLDWVIVGGERGTAKQAVRPMHPAWAQSLRDQCQKAGVAFFFKQWGCWVNADHSVMKGLNPNEFLIPGRFGIFTSEGVWWPGQGFGHRKNLDGLVMYRVGSRRAGRQLDGREWSEWPEDVREIPRQEVAYEAP